VYSLRSLATSGRLQRPHTRVASSLIRVPPGRNARAAPSRGVPTARPCTGFLVAVRGHRSTSRSSKPAAGTDSARAAPGRAERSRTVRAARWA
jgi:hypothetical protein